MTCKLRCPLNGQICEGCMNDDSPADGPDPDMYGDGHPHEDDWDCNFSILPHNAGTWGI